MLSCQCGLNWFDIDMEHNAHHFFVVENAENDYFDQRFECAVPICWSKYTTNMML